jgi:hypothetical protein
MARKIEGKPKFDSVQLMKLTVDRGGEADGVEAVIAYVDSKSRQMFGSVTLAANSVVQHFSEKSRKMLADLFQSLEDDAANVIFGDAPEEAQQEGIHVEEPRGIAEAEEECPQV